MRKKLSPIAVELLKAYREMWKEVFDAIYSDLADKDMGGYDVNALDMAGRIVQSPLIFTAQTDESNQMRITTNNKAASDLLEASKALVKAVADQKWVSYQHQSLIQHVQEAVEKAEEANGDDNHDV